MLLWPSLWKANRPKKCKNASCCLHFKFFNEASGLNKIKTETIVLDRLSWSSIEYLCAAVISHLCTCWPPALVTGRGTRTSFVDSDCTTSCSAHAVSTPCLYSKYVKSGTNNTRKMVCVIYIVWIPKANGETEAYFSHHLRKWTLLFPWSTTKPNGVKARKAGFPDTSWKTRRQFQNVTN